MADDDDDFIDLLKRPKDTQKDIITDVGGLNTKLDRSEAFDPELIASWNPGRRDYPNVLLITFALFALVGVMVAYLSDRRGGLPIAALVIYTVLIPYILSDRFLSFVPWALLKRFSTKFVPVHCLAMTVVYGITSLAFYFRPRLPAWFNSSGRRPALFYYFLGGVLLGLAFWECSWIGKHKERDTSGAEEES